MGRVTLLTDFGTADGYVGALKAVLAARFPGIVIDDVTHDITPGDVPAAARALVRFWRRYPPGTVHLAVVDPGVGTERRPMAVEADRRFLVLPDNGLASEVLRRATEWRAVEIDPERLGVKEPSATFHGRDLFAPAAALLARGAHLLRLGPALEDPVELSVPAPRREEGRVLGEIVTVDRFGNLISNIPMEMLSVGEGSAGEAPEPGEPPVGVGWEGRRVRIDGREVVLCRTYGDVAPGGVLALVNSDGWIEVAVRDGSAAQALGLGSGAAVEVGYG